jgi:hypothetical protein
LKSSILRVFLKNGVTKFFIPAIFFLHSGGDKLACNNGRLVSNGIACEDAVNIVDQSGLSILRAVVSLRLNQESAHIEDNAECV